MLDPVTLVYKTVSASKSSLEDGSTEIPLRIDVYLPDSSSSSDTSDSEDEIPAVLYFHGGGLLVGDRKSWFPEWLHSGCFVRRFVSDLWG